MQRYKRSIFVPFDYQAERTVIGAIISGDDGLLDCVLGKITHDDFIIPAHRAILLAIVSLKVEGHIIHREQIAEFLRGKNQDIGEYFKTLADVSIQEDELKRLCQRIRDCFIGRIVINQIAEHARGLAEGDIDAVKFLQLSHASIFDAISRLQTPALAGIESCKIIENLPELAYTGDWYVPLIKCLQTRCKNECEQLSEGAKSKSAQGGSSQCLSISQERSYQ